MALHEITAQGQQFSDVSQIDQRRRCRFNKLPVDSIIAPRSQIWLTKIFLRLTC
jgi:hypothetical protein